MKTLTTGQHFGQSKNTLRLQNIILTEASNIINMDVPWHYHENAYFCMILRGHLEEVNKKEITLCKSGTILYHNWQESHYNRHISDNAHYFHIEIEPQWFTRFDLKPQLLEGSFHLENPILKPIFYKIYQELKNKDAFSPLAVDGLLAQAFSTLIRERSYERSENPQWTTKVRELLRDSTQQNITLQDLSLETGLHSVYLSAEFSKYFGVSFGQYQRSIKIEKSKKLLLETNYSITDIAYTVGFSDQSHLIRCFKEAFGIIPLKYRKLNKF